VVSNDSDQPIIGLTTYLEQAQTGVWDVPAAFLPRVYFDAITRAGGIAVLLPPQPVDARIAGRVLDGLDGLILTGGKDIDPARYGQEPHPATDVPRLDRDAWEDALLRAAIARELPFLGICRGLQVLNVALGGTLLQHLPDVVGSTKYNLGRGDFNSVPVSVAGNTRLSQLVGDAVEAKVYHHQAIDRVADGLRVSARSADNIIQAVELDAALFGDAVLVGDAASVGDAAPLSDAVPFGVAVQWHPEETGDDLRLFSGLVDAARNYADSRSRDGASRDGAVRDAASNSATRGDDRAVPAGRTASLFSARSRR
jgi:putative glutamine amidotransferase